MRPGASDWGRRAGRRLALVPGGPELTAAGVAPAAEVPHKQGKNSEMTPLPVVLAVDEGRDALGAVEAQLIQRYAHDYRVVCLGDPGVALQKLTELGVDTKGTP